MFLKLSRAAGHEDEIRAFRQLVCHALGLEAEKPMLEPLPHALYLFAFQEHGQPPVGMIEFFLYEDAFASYENSIYNQAYDLATIGPRNDLIHIRSLVIKDQYRHSSTFVYLCAAVVEGCFALGRRYMTVVTSSNYHYALLLYQAVGMQKLGTFLFQGEPQQLCGMELESAARLARRLRRNRPLPIDGPGLVEQLRNLRQAPLTYSPK